MHRHFSNHLHGRYLKSGQASHTRKKLLERVRPGRKGCCGAGIRTTFSVRAELCRVNEILEAWLLFFPTNCHPEQVAPGIRCYPFCPL